MYTAEAAVIASDCLVEEEFYGCRRTYKSITTITIISICDGLGFEMWGIGMMIMRRRSLYKGYGSIIASTTPSMVSILTK